MHRPKRRSGLRLWTAISFTAAIDFVSLGAGGEVEGNKDIRSEWQLFRQRHMVVAREVFTRKAEQDEQSRETAIRLAAQEAGRAIWASRTPALPLRNDIPAVGSS